MRDIKFRAWSDMEIMRYNIMPISDRVAYDLNAIGKDKEIWEEFEYMQYTGLKDKNGKEIYEGDIIYIGEIKDSANNIFGDIKKMYAIVKWNDYFAKWILKAINFQYHYAPEIDKDLCNNHEIIGNIYENLELLEVNNANKEMV